MKIVGMIATGVIAVAVVVGIVVLLMSIPDIKRYMKIRQM